MRTGERGTRAERRPGKQSTTAKRACLLIAITLSVGSACARAGAMSEGARPGARQLPSIARDTPVSYRISFPHPEQHWMAVEVTFADVGPGPLRVHISRSSPGRYALHEFTKNVYDVHGADRRGNALIESRPSPDVWELSGHDGTVTVRYKVFGDRVDGTYLAVDRTHAHINMPASLMWAEGLESRPASVRFEPPAGLGWKVATQLHRTADPATFTAANLQYLMDSPTELSRFTSKTFTVEDASSAGGRATFHIALHHTGTDEEAQAFADDVQRIVRQEQDVFGEFPPYEPGSYTFLADYLPWGGGDGMEHRNSTSISSTQTLRGAARRLLGTVAHEFFHSWNVERIRPRSLEPFRFDRPNPSGELWLAEGFTTYYQELFLARAGLVDRDEAIRRITGIVGSIASSPASRFRTAEEMSLLALVFDGGRPIDRTNADSTFLSYYTWGAGLGLAVDLELRQRSGGRTSLDDYMRAMWRKYGKPGGPAEGLVGRPYTIDDARVTLGEVAHDGAFADDFFRRFVQGHELPDYGALLAQAGISWRSRTPPRGWAGDVRLEASPGGVRIAAPVKIGTPLYDAGLQQDDTISHVDGSVTGSPEEWLAVLDRHRSGDRLRVTFTRRDGENASTTLVLQSDPGRDLVAVETLGQTLSAAQRTFRERWLGATSR